MAHSHDTESSKYEQECYVDGAEDGYEYAVDKACEWLREHLGAPAGVPQAKSYDDAINELTTEFRKGMYND